MQSCSTSSTTCLSTTGGIWRPDSISGSSTEAGRVRICIVSKFPPIEGGIASRTYWRVRRLLDAGHEVAVVTNAGSVESDYRITGCEDHLKWLVEERGLLLRDVAR